MILSARCRVARPLPEKNKDHELSDDILVLTLARTGSHSDLFGK